MAPVVQLDRQLPINLFMILTWLLVIIVSLTVICLMRYLLRNAKCKSRVRLDGITALVTGCNTGIGKETVRDLYRRGARVVMACRNLEKAEEARKDIEVSCKGSNGLGQLDTIHLDLCSLESVRKCARHVLNTEPKLSILINNAGVLVCPFDRTKDGFETHFGSNHLAHALLTLLLLPKLRQAKQARIVTVSSLAHKFQLRPMLDDLNWERKRYDRIQAYALSKTANIAFSRHLAEKLKEHNITNVTTYSLHPGVIKTDIGRHLDGLMPGLTYIYRNLSQLVFKTPVQGAQTTLHCAVSEECSRENGLYYSECAVSTSWFYASSNDYAAKMWEKSMQLLKLGDFDPFIESDRQVTSL